MAGIFTKHIWQPCICQPKELKREIRKKTVGVKRGVKKKSYSVSYFNLGALGLFLEGEAHQSIPVTTGRNPPELPISDEVRNNAHIASTGMKLH